MSEASLPGPELAPRVQAVRTAAAVTAAVLVAGCLVRFGFSGQAFLGAFFCVILVVLSVTDLEQRLIPNRIVLPATAVALAAQAVLHGGNVTEFVAAGLGAALLLLLPLLVYPAGMGMGDVKLTLFLGAVLGRDVLDALVVAFLAAFAGAVLILLRDGSSARKRSIAFGPYLALGGLAGLFFGESIVQGLLG